MLVKNPLQVIRIHHLDLDQVTGQVIEDFAASSQCVANRHRRLVDDPLHLGLDLADRLGTVHRVVAKRLRPLEGRTDVVFAIKYPAHLATHAKVRDHPPGNVGGSLQVVLSTRRRLLVHDLLGHNTAQQAADLVLEFRLHHQLLLVIGPMHRVTQCTVAARDDRNLVHGIGVGQHTGHQCVAALVVGYPQLFVLMNDPSLLLQPRDHPLHTLLELSHRHSLLVASSRQQCRLVDQVGQVGTDKSRSDPGQAAQIDAVVHLDLAGMHLENRLATLDVRSVDQHVTVETARPQQCRVERFGAVGRSHDDHTLLGRKPVHLDQQCVQGLLTLVVTAGHTTASHLAQCVEFVDEDDRR